MPKLHLGELQITSPAFEHGGAIPERFTGEGDDVSPELRFSNVPDGAESLVVICHDPDAPLTDGFTHWILAGIPADAGSIPEGGGSEHVQGTNDFGAQEYGGPAPPPGHGTHHYFFHVYALDTDPGLSAGVSRNEVLARIDDHIIEQNRLVGTFSR